MRAWMQGALNIESEGLPGVSGIYSGFAPPSIRGALKKAEKC
jgi:hypothetical protein